MSLLLEYMYRGCISVKQQELQDILKSASTLQIRGRIILKENGKFPQINKNVVFSGYQIELKNLIQSLYQLAVSLYLSIFLSI